VFVVDSCRRRVQSFFYTISEGFHWCYLVFRDVTSLGELGVWMAYISYDLDAYCDVRSLFERYEHVSA